MSQEPSTSFLEDSFFSEMLSSQSNLEDQVEQLIVVLNNSDCRMEEKLSELQNFFTNSNIQNVPIDILDDKIFNPALTSMQNMHFEVMEKINQLLQNKTNRSLEELKCQLNVLINLLKCWEVCISHIKTIEKVSIIDLKSIPDIFFNTMNHLFRHCKNSANDYQEYFQLVSHLLASLFRHCSTTLNSFYILMDSVILFDANQEEEMRLLLKILDETGKLATLASGMDAKTLTDMWKRFGKFATNYGLKIKGISPSTITHHFKGLSENIVTTLSAISQSNQDSSNERSILCCRLLLKILEKLCETYCGWIRNDVMIDIIKMLTNLYRYSEQYLKVNGYNSSFIQFISSNFSFTFNHFLEVVFENDTFKLTFFDCENIIRENAIGYHLLLLSVMKKLSTLPYETQSKWYNKDSFLLETCFRNIDKLSKEICIGKIQIQISRDITQGSYLASIYEATCISLFSIVCQISNSEFPGLMNLLLKYLLSGKFFSCLLSSDVWCFVCRLGSSELCYDHFKYLANIYEKFRGRKNCLNILMLSNLIGRQYTFLSDKDKSDFINNIEKLRDPHRWTPVTRFMSNQKKKELQNHLHVNSFNAQLSVNIKNLEDQPSYNNFCSLLKSLFIMESSYAVQNEQSIDSCIKIWGKIISILSDCEGMSLFVLEDLTTSLLRASHPTMNQSKYMTSILESMNALYPYASSGLHLEMCHFLNRCVTEMIHYHSNALSELFYQLLRDKNCCVQQQAYESFECLTRLCPDTNLLSSVALALRNTQSELSKTLPAYLSEEPTHAFTNLVNSEEFFITLCSIDERNNKHVCPKKSECSRKEKLPKLDEDAEKHAERVCTDMELILKLKKHLSRDVYDKLSDMCQRFLNQ